ncbi:MAG: Patatin [Acidimicrobiia bacterium]|nr:Patatin [Acidimicrobiia bacterium]
MTQRAIILAGGGIRVAWQSGVVQALDEAGLTFDHGDGTSGGIFTLGMLLSGVAPSELGERWRTLSVRRFLSLLPLRSYLRSPTDWAAFGGSDGIRNHVLPHLGIDVDRIRNAQHMTGTFNVARFDTKSCVPISNRDIDLDRMIAGVSLAVLMPAVEADGAVWTDAVWIQDANLMDAVRQGCTELWVTWCIANTNRWGRGALEQYVHMIELSAVSSLNGELAEIADINRRRAAGEAVLGTTEAITVHMVKPAHPLPLDPDFVLGRIDAETLVAMGYRDACRYRDQRTAEGIVLDGSATAMAEPPLGARLTIRFEDQAALVRACVVLEASDLAALRAQHTASMSAVGAFTHPQFGYRPFRSATAQWTSAANNRILQVQATMHDGKQAFTLALGITDGRQARWSLADGTGVVDEGVATLSWRDVARSIVSFEPAGAHSLGDRVRCLSMAWQALRG